MTLIQSAKLYELDPYVYLADVFIRLQTHRMKDIQELLHINGTLPEFKLGSLDAYSVV